MATLNTRIKHKHDNAENWAKATNFKPLFGEIIIYDADTSNPFPRIKIGDGDTFINDLPFVYEAVTEADIEEICGSVISISEVSW